MPAKSEDQQQAAGIALSAKREGTVDDLRPGAAKEMAKSMSEKELEKLASTDHRDISENRTWGGASLTEVFREEMLGTEEDGEAIASDKPTLDQIEDAGRDKEDDTGWDEYDDAWDNRVNAAAPMAQAGRAMGSNVTGAARVSYESLERMPAKKLDLDKDEMKCPDCYGTGYSGGHGDTMSWRDAPKSCDRCDGKGKVKKENVSESRNPNSLDILFEQSNDEYYTSDEVYDIRHSSDWDEVDMDDPHGIARSEIDYDKLENFEETIKDEVKGGLDYVVSHKRWNTGEQKPSLEFAIELAEDEIGEISVWGKEAEMLDDTYGDDVDEKWHKHPAYSSRLFTLVAKKLGTEAWEEWSSKKGDLDEQAASPEMTDWAEPDYAAFGQDDLEDDSIGMKMSHSLIEDMAQHVVSFYVDHGKPPEDWRPEELLSAFEYEYPIDPASPDDVVRAEQAIEQAKEEIASTGEAGIEGLQMESVQRSSRWKKLAGILTEDKTGKKKVLNEMEDAQLKRYVSRMAKHGWEWLDIADKLTDQYGVTVQDVETFKPDYDAIAQSTKQEAMLGGVSNSAPNPGHRAKMNEDSPLEYFDNDQSHRVDVYDARDELAGLAYEIAGDIQGMHLDSSDRRTERMIQNKMGNMYKFLRKLKNLAN